jgi:hypothetical protein
MKRFHSQSHFSRHTTAIRVGKMSWRITNAYIHGCRITNSAGRSGAIQFHSTSKKELAKYSSATQIFHGTSKKILLKFGIYKAMI